MTTIDLDDIDSMLEVKKEAAMPKPSATPVPRTRSQVSKKRRTSESSTTPIFENLTVDEATSRATTLLNQVS
jgi:hypothetical protein